MTQDHDHATDILEITCGFCGTKFTSAKLGSADAASDAADEHECDPDSWRSAVYRTLNHPKVTFVLGIVAGMIIDGILLVILT